MNEKSDRSDTEAQFNAQVAKLKAEGWDVHHDSNGWYVVMPNEKEPEDGTSVGGEWAGTLP